MNIIDNRNSVEYQFSDLTPGQVFYWNDGAGDVYMAVAPWIDNMGVERNAVNLSCNCYAHFNPSCIVTPLDAELVIK